MGTFKKLFWGTVLTDKDAVDFVQMIAKHLGCEVSDVRLDCEKKGEYHAKFIIFYGSVWPLRIGPSFYFQIGANGISVISENGMLYIMTGDPEFGTIQVYKGG